MQHIKLAAWTEEGRVGGVYAHGIKRLLMELDLMEGVPLHKYDSYVAEIMLRADEDGDGMLSLSEFLIWFCSEVAALLPVSRNGLASSCPIYNRLLSYQISENGAGVRSKSSGLSTISWLKLCKDFSLCDETEKAREVIQVVQKQVASSRIRGAMEGGNKLQFSQQIKALLRLAGHLGLGAETIIYRLLSGGDNPPISALQGWHKRDHQDNTTYRRMSMEKISRFFLEGELETPLDWTKLDCSCGEQHARWLISNDEELRAYSEVAGFPYSPALRIVNMRNVRAVFTRYCFRYNKGKMIEDSPPHEEEDFEEEEKEEDGEGDEEEEEEDEDEDEAECREVASRVDSPQICCCQYRSGSLMELQTFWQLVTDNRTLSKALKASKSNLTAKHLERAFLQCCSISGVYCSDDGIGIHDQPIHPSELESLTLPVPPRLSSSPRKNSSTATRFDAGATMMNASETGRAPYVARRSANRVQVVQNGGVGTWMGGVEGSAPSPLLFSKFGPSPSDSPSHRPPVPSLGFIQFLEALRLLAEDLIGHPTVQVAAEVALLTILHDAISAGQCLQGNKKSKRI